MSNKPITHLIVDTSSSDEDFNGGCDYCLVEMTAEYVIHLLRHMDKVAGLQQVDEGVYALECWDSSPGFFCWNDKLEELSDILGNSVVNSSIGEPVLLDADPRFGEEHFQRVECLTVQISEDDVWWTACVKNANTRIETDHVPKETLLEILDSFGESHEPCSMDGDSAVRRVHDLLYLDADGDREYFNPEKEWDADTVSAIADVVNKCIPKPTSDLESDCSSR
jgi:hypothetical protein